jgi:hypothetical protein
MSATSKAFDQLREQLVQPRLPPRNRIANTDETKLMTVEDGLRQWVDGDCDAPVSPPDEPPLLEAQNCPELSLWVVRLEDVVHAREDCAFGKSLASGMIKHTNLTGGAAAYSGGELIVLDRHTIVINGRSGRYGPKTESELQGAARAFADSGYRVWYMGWDEDANRPAPFLGSVPRWLS